MVLTLHLATGALAVNGTYDLPAWAPPIRAIRGAIRQELTEGAPNTWTNTALTVVPDAADITGNNISLVDENTIRTGVAFTTSTLLLLVLVPKGEYSGA